MNEKSQSLTCHRSTLLATTYFILDQPFFYSTSANKHQLLNGRKFTFFQCCFGNLQHFSQSFYGNDTQEKGLWQHLRLLGIFCIFGAFLVLVVKWRAIEEKKQNGSKISLKWTKKHIVSQGKLYSQFMNDLVTHLGTEVTHSIWDPFVHWCAIFETQVAENTQITLLVIEVYYSYNYL